MDNLSLVCLPPSEDDDWGDDDGDDDVQSLAQFARPECSGAISAPSPGLNEFSCHNLPSSWDYTHVSPCPANFCIVSGDGVSACWPDWSRTPDLRFYHHLSWALPARPEDGLFLRCSPQCKDEDDDDDDGDVDCDDDDDDDDDVQIRSWKGKDLMLESISDVETHPGLGRGPEDMRLMHRSKRRFSPSLMHTKVHWLHHVGQGGLKLQDLKSSACFDLPECLDSRIEPLCPAQRFTFQSFISFELLSVHDET
ncbi:aspartate-rich protein 1-like isoform X3 [Macaca nemestrina]|uniref:aspartate-rich protein 1-like isoform X3 n=1 Tax=Macaca nemestrina TaxID=9545 RepID=UPI0039B9ABFB